MFRVTLCLPSAAQRRAIQTLCQDYFTRRSEELQIHSVTEKKLDTLVKSDLVFLSVEGPRPNGLDTAQAIRSAGGTGAIVFLAAGPEYAMDAFGVFATQYFIPPVSRNQLFAMLDQLLLTRRGPYFVVSTREGLVRVAHRDVEYVECTDHILHFHLRDGSLVRSITLRVPLKEALADLMAKGRFYQPHRSYVINLDAVRQLTDSEFIMESGAQVPVPRGRVAEAREIFLHLFEEETPEDTMVSE